MQLTATVLFCMTITACGGSSGSGTLIEGTVTEAGGAAHDTRAFLRHGAGERIGGVEVCALGECSVTDDQGQWGFEVSEFPDSKDVLFSFDGHGILTTTIVTIPHEADEVFISFDHVEGGVVEASSVVVDGHDHGAHDHGTDGHDHE